MSAVGDLLGRKPWYVVDLDGVVYEGDRLVPGAARALRQFRESGKRVMFVTNNSTRRPRSLAAKLAALGVPCSEGDVVNSALGAALFIRERGLDRPSGAFVIGTAELRALLRENGVAVSTDPARCSALLVGMDPAFGLATVADGLVALGRGVPFIACNRDASYPGEGGVLRPGCGAVVGALVGASLRRPDHEVGKPSPLLMRLALGRMGARAEDCVVFGDSLETDIAMAGAVGAASLWVRPSAPARRRTAGARPTGQVASLGEAADHFLASRSGRRAPRGTR